MKIILLLTLFGISFCDETVDNEPRSGAESCSVTPVAIRKDKDCISETLKKSVEFMRDAADFICAYKAAGDNSEKLNAAIEKFHQAVKCTTCNADKLFGTGPFVQETGDEAVEAGAKIVRKAEHILSHLPLAKEAAEALCELVKILKSPCLQKALNDNLPTLLPDLKALFCESQKEKASVIGEKLGNIVKASKCVNQELLESGKLDKLLDKVGDLAATLSADLLKTVEKLKLVSNLGCQVIKLLDGTAGSLGGNVMSKVVGGGGVASVGASGSVNAALGL